MRAAVLPRKDAATVGYDTALKTRGLAQNANRFFGPAPNTEESEIDLSRRAE
jgi:hypothetical protein